MTRIHGTEEEDTLACHLGGGPRIHEFIRNETPQGTRSYGSHGVCHCDSE